MPVSPGTVLYVLDLFGTAVFAVSGALAAGRRRMDLFGALVIAAVTAVGGGTIRDLILDRHPVFWIQDLRYLAVIAGAGGLTFAYTSVFRPPRQSLEVADAFGLAVFSVVGARVALGVGAPPVVVVIMSAVTATVGGMVRDVLCDETPLILREEIYATAALSGGVLYLGLRAAALPEAAVAGLTIVAVSTVRLAALRWGVHLPSFRVEEAG
ncbi:putative membrane protein YeiH [Salinibacter ruber]|uniref:trimeric intracellular cation channel family protein n=1 Tax=Salinibacter ruber TaxID=146919 RepID=UPI00216927B4|nr:trimeric intracellular cation channel family protein [Salinibacter ruber]MCS3830566.1 putative membrane protein YeiH [Salinibacter ruber]